MAAAWGRLRGDGPFSLMLYRPLNGVGFSIWRRLEPGVGGGGGGVWRPPAAKRAGRGPLAPARQGRCAPPAAPPVQRRRTTRARAQRGRGRVQATFRQGKGGSGGTAGGAAGAQSAHKGAGAGQMAGPRSFGFAGPGPKAPGLQNAAAPPTPPVSPPRYRVAAPCTATANMNIYRKTIKVYCISIKTMVSWFPEVDRIWKQRPWPG